MKKKNIILLIIVAILTITVSVESVLLFNDKKENNNNQENSERVPENNDDENKEQENNDDFVPVVYDLKKMCYYAKQDGKEVVENISNEYILKLKYTGTNILDGMEWCDLTINDHEVSTVKLHLEEKIAFLKNKYIALIQNFVAPADEYNVTYYDRDLNKIESVSMHANSYNSYVYAGLFQTLPLLTDFLNNEYEYTTCYNPGLKDEYEFGQKIQTYSFKMDDNGKIEKKLINEIVGFCSAQVP